MKAFKIIACSAAITIGLIAGSESFARGDRETQLENDIYFSLLTSSDVMKEAKVRPPLESILVSHEKKTTDDGWEYEVTKTKRPDFTTSDSYQVYNRGKVEDANEELLDGMGFDSRGQNIYSIHAVSRLTPEDRNGHYCRIITDQRSESPVSENTLQDDSGNQAPQRKDATQFVLEGFEGIARDEARRQKEWERQNPRIEFITASEAVCVYAEEAMRFGEKVTLDYAVLENIVLNYIIAIQLLDYAEQD